MEHAFTSKIKEILKLNFKKNAEEIFAHSLILQYLNEKTVSANRGSKSRGSFGNIYAVYVIVEDYLAKGFDKKGDYSKYEGAQFKELFKRQRELPYGAALQNHPLNSRMNAEFAKFFPTTEYIPILRNLETKRYWFNENLLKIKLSTGSVVNIAQSIINIIDEYIKTKQDSLNRFIAQCENLEKIGKESPKKVEEFILSLLAPNVDARLFEIVSFSILKYFYQDQKIIWGFDYDTLNEDFLHLYKTGRTNANDGGIDFVMKPLGRFFQVTETLDFKKYFLDIEKIDRYPISFVVKSTETVQNLKDKLRSDAIHTYVVDKVVDKYMSCIEDIINVPILMANFKVVEQNGMLMNVLDEIVLQSKVEFNYEEEVFE